MVREVLAQAEVEKRMKRKKEVEKEEQEEEDRGFPCGPGGETAPSAGSPGLVPGWGTRAHMPAPTMSPRAATKTQHSQNK